MRTIGREPPRLTSALPEPDELGLLGSLLDGRYLLEAVAGSGGYGVVYRSRHVRFDSSVAIKVFTRARVALTSDGSPRGDAPQEGRLLFKLAAQHPSFVRVLETGQIAREGKPPLLYLAMEWLDGFTLKDFLAARERSALRLSSHQTFDLFDDLVRALEIAHVQRVAHRDLKPANILLSRQEDRLLPKLLDFGIAKVGCQDPEQLENTSTCHSPYTPAYAAPEQWNRDLGATGPWTDVYSLALVMTEVLAGRAWHRGTLPEHLRRMVMAPRQRPTPGALGVELDARIDAVFARALAVDPRCRPRTAGAFWEELMAAAKWSRPLLPLRVSDFEMPSSEHEPAGARVTANTAPSNATTHSGTVKANNHSPAGLKLTEPPSPPGPLNGRSPWPGHGSGGPGNRAWLLAAVAASALLLGAGVFATDRVDPVPPQWPPPEGQPRAKLESLAAAVAHHARRARLPAPPPSESSPLAVGSGLQKGVATRPNSVPAIGTVRPHLARTGKQTASDSNDEREPTTSAGVVPVVADVNVSATDDLLFEDALQTRK